MLATLTGFATVATILSKSDQIELVKEYQETDSTEALERLISSNIRLAHNVAKKHVRRGVDFEDLLSCAAEGIMTAANKFNPNKKASFTTYARLWMTAKCQEYVQANSGTVHCGSRTAKKLWSSLHKARKTLGVDATAEAIAEHLNLDADDVRNCLKYMTSNGVRMDTPLDEKGGTVATLVADKVMRQDERMDRTQNSEMIACSVAAFADKLNDRQKAIFLGRVVHELRGDEKRDANSFGCTKQRVGQIEKQLRTKLVGHFTRSFGTDTVKTMLRSF